MPFDLVAEVRCFFGRGHRQLEGIFQHAVGADAGEHALLGDELPVGALEHAAADRGVFALGVLAHDVEVDVGFGAVGQRRAHAGHQLAGAQVHVLVEAAADRDQQAPERDMVRHARPADRAEQDRSPTSPAGPARRPASSRRSACRSRTTSRSGVSSSSKPKRRAAASSTLQRLRHGLLADPVAGDDRDPILRAMSDAPHSQGGARSEPGRSSSTGRRSVCVFSTIQSVMSQALRMPQQQERDERRVPARRGRGRSHRQDDPGRDQREIGRDRNDRYNRTGSMRSLARTMPRRRS